MPNLIGFHITNEYIAVSDGTIQREPPYIGFLLDSYPNTIKVFYDLDGSVASLCHLLEFNEDEAQKLSKGKIWLSNGYHMTYFPKSFFSIDFGGGISQKSATFANMNQVGYLDGVSYPEHISIEDSINKAKQARDTAIEVAKSYQYLNLPIEKLSSPVAAFLNKYKLDFFPTVDDCPDRINQLAFESVKGQWFEAYSLGNWDMAFDYDLNGSYCSELSKLPNVKQGKWVDGVVVPDNATLGISYGYLYINASFHPFLLKLGDSNYTCTGKAMLTAMTLQEIQFLYKWKLGTFKVVEGHWFIPNEYNKPPYAGTMKWLWDKKVSSQGKTRQMITRIYSGIWGRSLQTLSDGSLGDSANPIIGLTVETNSRLHVAEACSSNNIVPLAVMADGFITDKEVNLPLSDKLGEWKLSAKGKCIIAGSGAVCFEGDNPPEGLALRYDDLVNQINENSKTDSYTRSKYAPVTLALALQQGFDKIGTIQQVDRTLIIGNEDKRIFYDRPMNGGQLISGKIYESSAWDYKTLTSVRDTHQLATL